MAVDFYGRTVYSPSDNSESIQRRLGIIDDMGDQQNQFVSEKANRDKSARKAAINLRLQEAATQGVKQGTQNMQNLQKAGNAYNAGVQPKAPPPQVSPPSTSQPNNSKAPTGAGQTTKGSQSFEAFKAAIGKQESGNNYGARNPMSGAMGKYQIMPANIAGNKTGWDYQALGYDVTPSQFISSPQLQEKVASQFLQGYYKKYGPAGAAVAWYAGPSAAKKYVNSGKAGTRGEAGGHPSVSSYIQQILDKMGM